MTPAVAESAPPKAPSTIRQRTTDAVRAAAHLSHEAQLLTSIATDAVEDGVHAAKRTYKIAARRVEDATDDTATCIRRQPFTAVGVALGGGLLLGVTGAWIAGALGSRCTPPRD